MPINDQHDTGRYDGTEHTGGRGYAHGKFLLIPGIAHHLDFNEPQSRCIGYGRAGNARKDHAGHDVCMGKPPLDPPDKLVRKPEEAFCNPTIVHDLGRKDKEGNRE